MQKHDLSSPFVCLNSLSPNSPQGTCNPTCQNMYKHRIFGIWDGSYSSNVYNTCLPSLVTDVWSWQSCSFTKGLFFLNNWACCCFWVLDDFGVCSIVTLVVYVLVTFSFLIKITFLLPKKKTQHVKIRSISLGAKDGKSRSKM